MVVVISNNGGWTNALTSDLVTGRDLAFTRYEKIVEAMGGHGEFVEAPGEIRPALERAFDSGKPALVNVMTDPYAMALTQKFGGEHWS
jgi:acetolactate synthase-1/2/3 large subunit